MGNDAQRTDIEADHFAFIKYIKQGTVFKFISNENIEFNVKD